MTPTEVLNEIEKMPPPQIREVVERATNLLRKHEKIEPTPEEIAKDIERREREFAEKLLAENFISRIPPRDETDADDEFELLEFEGEPLSEQIIRERI